MYPLAYVFMGFGALLALLGVGIFVRMGTQGTSTVKMFGFEFRLQGSALVIFVLGVLLFMIPVIYSKRLLENGELALPSHALSECDLTHQWNILQTHRGSVTDAVEDILAFQDLVLSLGCIQDPYELRLNGKQNFNRFAITVLSHYASTATTGETYEFKKFQTSLDVGGELKHKSGTARRVAGSDESWEVLY